MEFKSLRNIESSFRQIRLFGIVFLSLAGTISPLMEIAEKNGFASANRFWEFCTEQMKQSPSELHKDLYDELCKERRKFYLGE